MSKIRKWTKSSWELPPATLTHQPQRGLMNPSIVGTAIKAAAIGEMVDVVLRDKLYGLEDIIGEKPRRPYIVPGPGDAACPSCGQKMDDGLFVCRQCELRGLFEMQLALLTGSSGRATPEQEWVCRHWGWPKPIYVSVRKLVGSRQRGPHQEMKIRFDKQFNRNTFARLEDIGTCQLLELKLSGPHYRFDVSKLKEYGVPSSPWCYFPSPSNPYYFY